MIHNLRENGITRNTDLSNFITNYSVENRLTKIKEKEAKPPVELKLISSYSVEAQRIKLQEDKKKTESE